MRSAQRQEYLLQKAQENNFVSISETAKVLETSIETVRRDINLLCQKGQLKKVHGGAAPVKLLMRKDADFMTRIHENQQAKLSICREAVKMIRDGDVVTMDSGATCYVLASCISGIRDVTFVVNSLRIAALLMDKLRAGDFTGRVILLGGELDAKNFMTYDAETVDELRNYHFHIAFVSCTSLNWDSVANSYSSTGVLLRRIMEQSNVCVLITDSDKIEKNSVYTFAKPTQFQRIIVDNQKPIPADLLNALQKSDTELTVVPCEEGGYDGE